jgi:hypothetical protein
LLLRLAQKMPRVLQLCWGNLVEQQNTDFHTWFGADNCAVMTLADPPCLFGL